MLLSFCLCNYIANDFIAEIKMLGRQWKACPKVKLHGLIAPTQILNSSSRIHFNWFNRIHFKLILLTLLFKSLFFKTNLKWSYILLPDNFQALCNGVSVNLFYQKRQRLINSYYLVPKCTMCTSNLELKQ